MNWKIVFIGLLALIVLSGCTQPQAPASAQPAAPPAPPSPAPTVKAPTPSPAAPSAPSTPTASPAQGSCRDLEALLNAGGNSTDSCKRDANYDMRLDVNEDRFVNADDRALFAKHSSDQEWCSRRLTRTVSPCNLEHFVYPSCETRIRGDFNGDGKVTQRDAASLSILAIVGKFPERAGEFNFFPPADLCCFDIDGSGKFGAEDYDPMNRLVLGKDKPGTC